MRRFVRENGLSLFFFAHLRADARRAVVCGPERVQRRPGRARRRADLVVVVCDLVRLRRRRDGELAIRVPPVLALHPRDDLARPEGVERVEGARRRRVESKAKQRSARHAPARRAALGEARRLAHADLRELAPVRDDDDLLATWFAQSLNNWREFNADAARARRADRSAGRATSGTRTSGSGRSRTGNPSSSPSGRWPCSRSTCASAARRSRSRSAHRTTRPPRPDRTCPRDSP